MLFIFFINTICFQKRQPTMFYRLLFILILLAGACQACSPGKEAAARRLLDNLGIAPAEGGITNDCKFYFSLISVNVNHF